MKYMGSKRAMLQNGLGNLLDREIASANRFVDLFVGSGAVANHVAQKYSIPVLAYDLQAYSSILTNAMVTRTTEINWKPIWDSWLAEAKNSLRKMRVPRTSKITVLSMKRFRSWCAKQSMPITRAYGGHYFSPRQAVWIDALRNSLPSEEPVRTVALAALIKAASQCAASPGHTAQPFQPTRTAKKFLKAAWDLDLVKKVQIAFESMAGQYAKSPGEAKVGDAIEAARELQEGDLVFIDPPYSGVHYSRFYHVLETIATGDCGPVEGVGRYPSPVLRPRSRFSLQKDSAKALDELLSEVANRKAKAIVTFPNHECSNGLSGNEVVAIANKHFTVTREVVKSKFSTLGGNRKSQKEKKGRFARQSADEMIIVLKPK